LTEIHGNIIISKKIVVFIGIILSVALASLIFRDFLLNPGVVGYGDLQWPYYGNKVSTQLWSEYLQVPVLPTQMIIWFFLWNIPLAPALLERFIYMLIFVLMFLSTFFVVFTLMKRETENDLLSLVIACTAAIAYVLNPMNVYYMPHIFIIFGYALFPLVIYFTLELWQGNKVKPQYYAIIFGILLTIISSDLRWPVWCLLSIAVLFATLTALKNSINKKFLTAIALGAFFTLLLSSFWLFPFLDSVRSDPTASLYKPTPETLGEDLYGALNQHTSIFNSMRFQSDFWEPTRQLFIPENGFYLALFNCAGLILPALALTALILNPRDKRILALSVLSLIIIILASAPMFPLRLISEIYHNLVLNTDFGIYFRTAYKSLLPLSFVFVLLASYSISAIYNKSKHFKLSNRRLGFLPFVLVCSVLITAAAINSWPLLTGNLNGLFKPELLSNEYQKAYDVISLDDEYFLTMLLPSVPNGGAPFPYFNSRYCMPYLNESAMANRTANLSDYISFVGVKYVIVNKIANEVTPFFEGTDNRNDLKSIYEDHNLTVYKVNKKVNVIKAVGPNGTIEEFLEKNYEDSAKVVNYSQVNPTLWKINLISKEPFMLSFAQGYSPLWEATIYKDGNKVNTVKPTPIYNIINGFWIDDVGNIEVVVRYKLQDWFETGLLVSGISFAAIMIYTFYDWRKTKR